MRDAVLKINGIGIDTLLVLLFLAVEVGRSADLASIESVLMGTTMLVVLVLPYFLPAADTGDASLTKWLTLRGAAMICGLAGGSLLPESMRFVPMYLLIIAGICSCCIQF